MPCLVKAAYLAVLLMKRQESVVCYSDKPNIIDRLVANRMSGQLLVLDKLKKANAIEAYFYWCEVVHLLRDLPPREILLAAELVRRRSA